MSRLDAVAFNIKNDETDRLARELAAATGETMTQAITIACRERLARVKAERRPRSAALAAIAAKFRDLPVLDSRPADEPSATTTRGLPR